MSPAVAVRAGLVALIALPLAAQQHESIDHAGLARIRDGEEKLPRKPVAATP